MYMNIIQVINETFSALDSQLVFVCCVGVLTLCFLINFTLSLFRCGYKISKRVWFLFVGFCGYSFLRFMQLYNGNPVPSSIFLVVFFFFSSICFCVRTRERKTKKAERELIRFIDGKIKEGESFAKEQVACKPLSTLTCKPKEQAINEINYSHIKNVLERLNYFSLKESDKRQVRELEYALCECEKGNVSPLLRSKVNDGLGALLKMMAKYGV